MLYVYDPYKYVYSYNAWIVCRRQRRQILTPKVDPRAVKVMVNDVCLNNVHEDTPATVHLKWKQLCRFFL